MTWFTTLVVAVLTAAGSAFLSGVIATRAVTWYRISSFEGGSSYFVAMIAIGGLIAGFIAGFIIARVVAAGASPGFLKALGYSFGLIFLVAGASAATTRLLADVPPTIKGEKLTLLVELRFPAAQHNSPATDSTAYAVELGAVSGNTVRTSKQGPLWTEDARLENGHWIVPGAVEVFTERGRRRLTITPDIADTLSFDVPLDARPNVTAMRWSEWISNTHKGSLSANNAFAFRFRIVTRNQPARTQQFGAFDVSTTASQFYIGGYENNHAVIVASATYTIAHRGEPQSLLHASSIATLPGMPIALLAQLNGEKSGCNVIEDNAGQMRTTFVSRCESLLIAEPLTNDQSWRDAATTLPVTQGRVDRLTFMHPGTYLFSDAVFDAEHRTIRPTANTEYNRGFDRSIAPIGVSPDENSYVRLGWSETTPYVPALLVFNMNDKSPYLLPIDLAATRYPGPDGLNNQWLTYYYEWNRVAESNRTEGSDRLTARVVVKPLPFRGAVHVESGGNVAYHVNAAGKELAAAIVEFLEADFHAQRTVTDEYGVSIHTFVEDTEISVFVNETERKVMAFGAYGSDTRLIRRIAAQFNERLATGKYDAMFSYAEQPH